MDEMGMPVSNSADTLIAHGRRLERMEQELNTLRRQVRSAKLVCEHPKLLNALTTVGGLLDVNGNKLMFSDAERKVFTDLADLLNNEDCWNE